MRCETCGQFPEHVGVARYHALRIWRITVRCHGQTEIVELAEPPMDGQGLTVSNQGVV